MTVVQGPENQLTQKQLNAAPELPGSELSHHEHEQIQQPIGASVISLIKSNHTAGETSEIVPAEQATGVVDDVSPTISESKSQTSYFVYDTSIKAVEDELDSKKPAKSRRSKRIALSAGGLVVAIGAASAFLLSSHGSAQQLPAPEAVATSTPDAPTVNLAPQTIVVNPNNPASPKMIMSSDNFSHEPTQIKPSGFNDPITVKGSDGKTLPVNDSTAQKISAEVISKISTYESYALISGDPSYVDTSFSQAEGATCASIVDGSTVSCLEGQRIEATQHANRPELGSLGLHNQPNANVEYTLPTESSDYTVEAQNDGSFTITITGVSAKATLKYESGTDFIVKTETAVKKVNNSDVFSATIVRDNKGFYTYQLNNGN